MDKNDQAQVSPWDIVVAGTLLTRLPLPHAPKSAFEQQARSVWAFPIVGLIVGVIMCLVGALAMGIGLNAQITAALVIAAAILATGAMHEDGLADCVDGFWGGYAPERRLEIMKDSQIGTYGVLALIVMFILRWGAVVSLTTGAFHWGALIACAVLSRAMMPLIMSTQPHARTQGLAQSVGTPNKKTALIGLMIGAVLTIICVGLSAITLLIVGLAVSLGIAKLAKAKIGGQTGDILGATQILSETAMLITMAAVIH